jgi:allantoin racemase
MTTVLVIDPVVTDAWEREEEYQHYLDRVKGPETTVRTVSIARGPGSIETFFDIAFAVPEILQVIEDQGGGYDAVMVNCFADPGVCAIREIAGVPVVGAAEASVSLALLLGQRFAVLSPGSSAAAAGRTEMQARAMGVERRLAAAAGIDIPVLRLNDDPHATARLLIEAAQELVECRGADVIVLGCTGMAIVTDEVRAALPVPLIEPMAAAFKMAETLAELGLHHARTGLYMPPDKTKYVWKAPPSADDQSTESSALGSP